MKKLFAAAAFAATAALAAPAAYAAVVVNAAEVGDDVVFSYSGSLDLTGLNAVTTTGGSNSAAINPQVGLFISSPRVWTSYRFRFQDFSFGSGSYNNLGPAAAGDVFGMNGGFVFVNQGYQSGDAIAGSVTVGSTTFAALGVTPGSYVRAFANDETITVNVGVEMPDISAVPLPAALPLLLAGLGALGVAGRRRRAA